MSKKRIHTGFTIRGPLAGAVLAALSGMVPPKHLARCARCKKTVETAQPVAAGTVFYCSLECAD